MIISQQYKISAYYFIGAIVAYGIFIGRLKKRIYPQTDDDKLTLPSFFRKIRVPEKVHHKADHLPAPSPVSETTTDPQREKYL